MKHCSLLLAAFFHFGITGCAPLTPPIQLTSSFNAAQARQALEPGSNKISGSALVRQQGGGVVHCGGNEVSMIPVTDYATERMRHIYKSDQKGFFSVSGIYRIIRFEPDLPDYGAASRSVICDAQGMFEFDSVGDGEYYVVTQVTWSVGYAGQGGTLMQRVRVAGGETKKIVLSP